MQFLNIGHIDPRVSARLNRILASYEKDSGFRIHSALRKRAAKTVTEHNTSGMLENNKRHSDAKQSPPVLETRMFVK
jgi:hypothetical protein